jgi:hypothetical protein
MSSPVYKIGANADARGFTLGIVENRRAIALVGLEKKGDITHYGSGTILVAAKCGSLVRRNKATGRFRRVRSKGQRTIKALCPPFFARVALPHAQIAEPGKD